MSTAVLLSPMPAPAPHRWTIPEYRRLDRTGLFHDVKTMLLEGEVYVMPMPSPAHDTTLTLTDEYLRRVFSGAGVHVRNQMGFDIGTQNDPGPDLAVVPGSARDYAGRAPTSAVLIVEVAVTSFAVDAGLKAELYASARVPEYWVIDVLGRELHVFRDPVSRPSGLGSNAYRSHQVFGPTASVAPNSIGTAVTVADLLP